MVEYREVSTLALFAIVFSLLVTIAGIVVASIGIVDTRGESKCGKVEVDSSSDHINLIISLAYVVEYAILLIVLLVFVAFSSRSTKKKKQQQQQLQLQLEIPEVVSGLFRFLGIFSLSLWAGQTIELTFDCNNAFGIWLFSFLIIETILYAVLIISDSESRLLTSDGTAEGGEGREKTGRMYKKMKKMGG